MYCIPEIYTGASCLTGQPLRVPRSQRSGQYGTLSGRDLREADSGLRDARAEGRLRVRGLLTTGDGVEIYIVDGEIGQRMGPKSRPEL
jgi:hypothetical protein